MINQVDQQHNVYGLWSINRRQGLAMVLGILLQGIIVYSVDVAVQNFPVLSQPFNGSLFSYFAIANIFFCLSRLTSLFFGVTHGSWVGVVTAAGGLLGDYLSGRVSTFGDANIWVWFLGGALASFIAGLAVFQTHGRYNNADSIALAVMLAAVGEAIGLGLPNYSGIWLFHKKLVLALNNYLVETLPTIALILILLPILLILYSTLVDRISSNGTKLSRKDGR